MKQQLKIKGNKAIFKGFSKKMKTAVEDEVAGTTFKIADGARRNAPSDQGFLRNSIDAESQGLEGVVSVRAEYAPYMEFGTGVYVDAGQYADYAATFKGKTSGTFEEFKISLLEWMRRKGIEESALFPIMMHILNVGIRPQPFLFPTFQVESEKMMLRLRKKFKELNNASK